MTTTRRKILEFLAQQTGPVYGLDVVKAQVASRASLYVHLAWLEEAGFVDGREDGGNPPRRTYRITERGAAVLLPEARVR